ncbi:hypothetical protein NBRC110019_31910 [Neptunitalea chrysea]|uniref:Uncharacterized protein n=1 Tax=Neptunitalea chrysea TaxID=1647581 RepID=A0A9W6B923_9FLAO|nr:hypothetical protein [Neptunitalea chrysea]GLB54150.1 hypothetical protein NBRC110019_31910 [Neptunitalea chrysea]
MVKYLKIFEIAYLVIAIISIFEVIREYINVQEINYLFLMFGVVSIGMFFFRRYMRKRIEKQRQSEQNTKQ